MCWTHQREVKLRKIFRPKRGPCVSPAPNSTCIKHVWTCLVTCSANIISTLVCQALTEKPPHLSPAFSRGNASQGQAYVSSSIAIVRGERAGKNSRVWSGQRSLESRDGQNIKINNYDICVLPQYKEKEKTYSSKHVS